MPLPPSRVFGFVRFFGAVRLLSPAGMDHGLRGTEPLLVSGDAWLGKGGCSHPTGEGHTVSDRPLPVPREAAAEPCVLAALRDPWVAVPLPLPSNVSLERASDPINPD